jgi:hypothetical protein
MEGPDQQNYVSSRTAQQNPKASDGARYYVIAHRDPGVVGWVDTTGLPEGFHAMRFVYREDPPAEALPRLSARLVNVDEVRSVLPDDAKTVDPDARRREVAIRQEHIKHRYPGY